MEALEMNVKMAAAEYLNSSDKEKNMVKLTEQVVLYLENGGNVEKLNEMIGNG